MLFSVHRRRMSHAAIVIERHARLSIWLAIRGSWRAINVWRDGDNRHMENAIVRACVKNRALMRRCRQCHRVVSDAYVFLRRTTTCLEQPSCRRDILLRVLCDGQRDFLRFISFESFAC